ncbi:TetR/AcrR family transcriptional regulator [Paenibacillus sp. MBLB4367]|uniref:TetR/AcrR family transcriptional regulator n=1 Tax=Paenibacillus sp. MBLB4367 TaxID=3384767 RepID=UPI003907F6FE
MSKNKIIEAAVKLFSELGYYRTSMDDIAKQANVAKGTLYYHFSGKSELFESIVTEGFRILKTEIAEVLDRHRDTDDQIRLIVQKHVEVFLTYSELVHIISKEISNGIETETLERIESLKKSHIDYLADVMRGGYEEGVLKPLPFELAAAAVIGMIESACLYYKKNEHRMSKAELHEVIDAFVLSTLLTEGSC